MQASVSLQKMFSYSLILFGLIFVFATIVVIVIIAVYFGTKKKKEKPHPAVKQSAPANPKPVAGKGQIKQKYQAELKDLENMCRGGNVTVRTAYQKLSLIMRHFAREMTGQNVNNATLEDLERADMPALYEIIKECYEPEFSTESTFDIYLSIERARKVVMEWN